LHTGHWPDVPICRLTRIDLRGKIPCKACQQKFLTLAGTSSFHRVFHMGLSSAVPWTKSWPVCPLYWCCHSIWYADLTENAPDRFPFHEMKPSKALKLRGICNTLCGFWMSMFRL
jgi:hypothetical protein